MNQDSMKLSVLALLALLALACESNTPGLSYMVGVKCGLDTECPRKVQSWLGRPVDVAGGTITTQPWIARSEFVETGHRPLFQAAFPLLSIFNDGNLDDMAAAAAGDYDGTYEAMAKALAAWPNPLLSVRIGWEFNGDWYPGLAVLGRMQRMRTTWPRSNGQLRSSGSTTHAHSSSGA